jgi:MFS transporter, Spinster family, sphingosine-1-phosphate transporter
MHAVSSSSAPQRPAATLAVLTGLNAFNYLDRFITAPILPLIIADLALSDAQAGSLWTAFIVVYSLVCPLSGWLGDRWKRLHVAAAGVAVWSLATFASGLAASFAWLALARAVVGVGGVGEASYTVITPSLISDHYPAARRGRALSIFYAAMPVGIALGYVLGGQIASRFGWRPAFFVAGGPGFVLAMCLLFLREPTRGQLDARPADGTISWRQMLGVLRQRPSFFYNVAAQTIITFTMGGLGAWMPTYFVRERGLGVASAGTFFGGLLLAAGFLGTVVGGQVGDRLFRRFPAAHFSFSAWPLIASAPFTVVSILSPQPALFWSAMFVTLLLAFLNLGPLNAALVNVLPPDLRSRGFGLHTITIHLLGDALSPYLIGLTSDRIGLRMPVLITGLLFPLAGLILLLGRRRLEADMGGRSG